MGQPKSSIFKSVRIITGSITALVGIVVLIGWQYDIIWLKSPIPNTVTMKTNTALNFLLCGISLLMLEIKSKFRRAKVIATGSAFVALVIGSLTILQYYFGWDFGIDQLFFKDSVNAIATSHPGRMAPNTAVGFIFISCSMLITIFNPRKLILLSEFLIVFVSSLSLLSLYGYLSGLSELTGPATFTQMALHTAVAFIILAVGMFLTAFNYDTSRFMLEHKVLGILTASFSILLLFALLSISQITSLQKAADWVRHTKKVKYETLRFLNIVNNAEFDARSYALTGDTAFKSSFEKNSLSLKRQMGVVLDLTSDDSTKQERLKKLQSLTEKAMLISHRILDTYHTPGLTDLAAIIDSGERSKIMTGIQNLTNEIIKQEDRLLQQRDITQTSTANHTRIILIIGLIFQVLLLGYLFIFIYRETKARQQAINDLRQSEEKFRNVFENSPIGKSLTTIDGKINVNKEFANMLGYSIKELSSLNWNEIIHPDDIEERQQIVASILAGARKNARYQKRYIHKNGSIVWTEISTVLQRDENGEPLFFITSASDITERKQAEENLKKANEQLAEANKELESFSYSVSHDLRAPLRHISGFIELLQQNGKSPLDEKNARYINIISDAAQKMGELIDDLLDFSRTGRVELQPGSVDLKKLVEEVLLELETETKGRNIDWRIEDLPEVYADKSMMWLVMVNLISNALKYSRIRKKAKIEIGSLPGENNKKETVFFVRDNGVGFDPKYTHKLFGVFQRLHRKEEFEGTGIGLANVRRIIHRHGGKTWAEGALDKGATIYFSIPHSKSSKRRSDGKI